MIQIVHFIDGIVDNHSLNFLCIIKNDLFQGDNTEENPVSQDGVPAGYYAVSLIEALNGPCNQNLMADGMCNHLEILFFRN